MAKNGPKEGTTGDMNTEMSVPSNHLELFVKAGRDGESYGACPFCHRMFMILLLKANAGELTFTVTTVNMSKPPPDFKKLSSRLPVVVHGNEVLCDSDDIVQYIDDNFPNPDLRFNNQKAAEASLGCFSKFSFYIKEVSLSPTHLISELMKMDSYLAGAKTEFLCCNELSHLDCLMLPKLHHIRVVSKVFKNFEFPHEFVHLWRYLANAYRCEVFRKTCPPDQEIIYHWASKPELPRLSKDASIMYGPETVPRYTFDVPIKQINGHW
ncbi:LOW QUALITY PROTEIN: chloride intracellular channel protein 4-like [Lingula anatina]|uniref:LOW QUALITY PROTEIN: chloride intracellular channel protein 4-like n=1 Tax=Lingula anatina TaxID=7574 RepID=A0A1S3II55_LINAN|nr:LOW QUALITY PROTEIN: chloride intracellular channel protein 4-like [Lingula anatina]|eukprot:XP_013397897.1 LOW QUALITY PROTEIN: chloride intracellular channel protein 4-like [Lingula anatina]